MLVTEDLVLLSAELQSEWRSGGEGQRVARQLLRGETPWRIWWPQGLWEEAVVLRGGES